jgi:hypothetical protein
MLRALMKPRTTQLFLPYIHTFRALAILFIVTGHAVDAFIWPDGGDLERLLRIVFCNGSALFVFIAGYLFQHLSPRFEARNYYISKIKNVLIPYLLISIPAIVLFTTVMQRNTVWDGFYQNPVWKQVVLFYLTGYHLAPLWFVPMITIFYVIAPALIKLDRNHYLYYMLPFFAVISLLISRGSPSQSFLHFLSVYVLGMACSRFKDLIGNAMVKYVFLIPVLVLYVAMALVEYRLDTGTMTYWNYLQKVFASFFFLGLLHRLNDRLTSKTASTVAETSFGIFFLHAYFLTAGKLTYAHFFEQLPVGSVIKLLLLSLVTFAICVPVILCIKRVLGHHSRYVIGC